MKDIVKDSDDNLRKKSSNVSFPVSDEIKKISKQMMRYLEVSQNEEENLKYNLRPGVGLAGPQVGYSLRMTAILIPNDEELETGEKLEPIFKDVVINPKIVSESAKKAALATGEGCLSRPDDVEGYVERANKITVEYFNLNNEKKTIKLSGYPAIVFQHEIDHLNGKLYYDHINPLDPWKKNKNTIYI